MLNFLKSITGKTNPAKDTKESACSDKSSQSAAGKDSQKDQGGCCGGHCH